MVTLGLFEEQIMQASPLAWLQSFEAADSPTELSAQCRFSQARRLLLAVAVCLKLTAFQCTGGLEAERLPWPALEICQKPPTVRMYPKTEEHLS